jgi:hypothetical protein
MCKIKSLAKEHDYCVHRKKIKAQLLGFALLLAITIILIPLVSGEEVNHILTIQSPTPQENAWFGMSVSMSEDIVVVGENYANVGDFIQAGKAYIFDNKGNLISTLQSPTPNNLALLGCSVEVLGDVVVVGDQSDVEGLKYAGRAYMYSSDGTLIKTLYPPKISYGGRFGTPITLCEELILVSETGGETQPENAGMVHIFDSQGQYLKTLLSPSPKTNGKFGKSIFSGNGLLLISEYGDIGSDLLVGPGSVYVFDYDGNHLMTIQAPKPEDKACFGFSISSSNDKIVVSEVFGTTDGLWRAGKAYVYNINGDILLTLKSPSPQQNARFGYDVFIDGETIVIGEANANINENMHEGKAYVFDLNGNILANLTAPTPGPRGSFGTSVEVEGDMIVVSEGWATVDGKQCSGKVHFLGFGAQAPETTKLVETPKAAETQQQENTGGGIPGFPYVSTVIGLTTVIIMFYLVQRKK